MPTNPRAGTTPAGTCRFAGRRSEPARNVPPRYVSLLGWRRSSVAGRPLFARPRRPRPRDWSLAARSTHGGRCGWPGIDEQPVPPRLPSQEPAGGPEPRVRRLCRTRGHRRRAPPHSSQATHAARALRRGERHPVADVVADQGLHPIGQIGHENTMGTDTGCDRLVVFADRLDDAPVDVNVKQPFRALDR